MAGIEWTQDQLDKIKELYPDCYRVKDLVDEIGRSAKSIYSKASELGLKRNSNAGNVNLSIYGKKYKFKKGFAPWNKGLKGIQIGGIETQFKKGIVPKNTKWFGQPYLYKRIRINKPNETRWLIQVLGSNKRLNYARFLWEKEKGAIPKSHIVYYINGLDETKPPTIEDLGLMHRSENMNRNTIHRFPAELKMTIRILKKLNRTINETNKYRCPEQTAV